MSTVIIGSIFMDIKGFSRNPYLPTGTNIGDVLMSHGGVCRNVCENFARQGFSASFVSMTDRSANGREIREHLAGLGVDLSHVLFADNGMGLWLAILDNHGELVGSVSQQPDFSALEKYIDECGEEIIGNADSVVLEIDTTYTLAKPVLDMATRLGKPVYAIVGNMGVIVAHPELLTQVKCFICNEIEAGRLFDADYTRAAPGDMLPLMADLTRRAGSQSLVITMGAEGAVWYDGETGDKGHCPAHPATMVDSTGAGDAFFSGVVMALTRGMPLNKAVYVGSRLAACTIGCDASSCEYVKGLFEEV